MITVVPATRRMLEEVVSWLQQEEQDSGEGFHCNSEIIVSSYETGELLCALDGERVVAFAVYTLKSVGGSIDILEVHPMHRSHGIGTLLARVVCKHLSASGASFIEVQCSPRSSERFWRSLGFTQRSGGDAAAREPSRLVLGDVA